MNIESIQEAIKTRLAEADDLAKSYSDGSKIMPADVSQRITVLLGEVDGLKAQYDALMRLSKNNQWLEAGVGTRAAHLGWRESTPDEGNADIDSKSWRELEVHTPFGKKTIRYNVPLAVTKKGYASAFESYLRKGIDDMSAVDRKTLSEGVDTAGGFLVPEDYQAEILKKTATQAVIRSIARVISTGRDIVKFPKIVYATDDKYTSGVRLTWTGELPASASAHRVTPPVFGMNQIAVATAMASLPVSNDMLEDAAFDVMGLATDLFSEAFALGEDDAFVNGDGVQKPFGLVTRATVGTELISFVVSGSANNLTGDGLVDLFFGLPSQYRRNARWVMNSATAKVARKLKDSSNRYLWDSLQGGLSSPGIQDSLLGSPVLYDEFMPDVGTDAYPVLYGDFSGYCIVDRVGLSIQRLSELYAETNLTLLLARKRVGGDVIQPYRLRIQKCAT